jgi:hypothetical protein
MSDSVTLTGEDAQFKTQIVEPSPMPAEITSIDIRQENIFTFLDNAYYGTGGFRSGDYLVAHKRELFFDTRKKFAYYVNFVKPIIRAIVEPVFVKDAARIYNNEMLEKFIANVDNRGADIQRFVLTTTNICRRHSTVFIVVDNFTEQPTEQSDAVNKRIMPYCYIRKVNQLYEYKLDGFGNVEELLFLEKPSVCENGTLTHKAQYRRWTKTYTRLEEDENETSLVKTQKAVFVSIAGTERAHNLGVVPVVVMRDVELEQPQDFIAEPKLYDIARVNHAIFNKDSEIREIERNQAFAVFCVNQNKASNLTIGTNNVLFYPLNANPPQFVAPPMEVLSQLIADRKELREDLFRLAEQNGVVAVQDAKSGLALAYEFFAHESVLQQTSQIAETTEEKIIELFNKWTNQDIEYQVEYRSNFVPHGEESRLKVLDMVHLQNPPPKFKKKITLEEFKLLFPDAESGELDELEADYEEEERLRAENAKAFKEKQNVTGNEEE